MNVFEIRAQLNIARDEIRAAVQKYHEATSLPMIGNFEAYVQADGRVDYRISADSQVLFKSNDSLDTPHNRVRVLEALAACQARVYLLADRMPPDMVKQHVQVLNEAFDAWRMKPSEFSFQTFANSANPFGVRPTID